MGMKILFGVLLASTCLQPVVDRDPMSGDAGPTGVGSLDGGDFCDTVDSGNYCSHGGNYLCRLNRIRDAHARCSQDNDCELVQFNCNCPGYGQCVGVSVAIAEGTAFRAEAQAQFDHCLAESGCISCGSCLTVDPISRCVSGLCRTVLRWPDAGP